MIDPLDYPYSIYKSSDGDELLDAHNDIIAVFDPHTEPEIERMVAAAPEMAELLEEAIQAIWEKGKYIFTSEKIELTDHIKGLLRRIEGEEDPE